MSLKLRTLNLVVAVVWGAPAMADGHAKKAMLDYRRAEAAYARGEFTVAAERFEAAYEGSGAPAIVFDIAQAYRRKYEVERDTESLERAIGAYRHYLQKVKTSPQHAVAERFLVRLEAVSVLSRAPVAPSPPPTVTNSAAPILMASYAERRPRATSKKKWILGTLGGIAAVGIGLGFGLGFGLRSAESETLSANSNSTTNASPQPSPWTATLASQ